MYNYWNYLFACSPKEKHKKARRGIYVFSLEKHDVPNALVTYYTAQKSTNVRQRGQ